MVVLCTSVIEHFGLEWPVVVEIAVGGDASPLVGGLPLLVAKYSASRPSRIDRTAHPASGSY